MRYVAWLAVIVVLGCGESEPAFEPGVCGNGVCEPGVGERWMRCEDCERCGDCLLLERCHYPGSCLAEFRPGTYAVTVASSLVSATRMDGTPWDPDGPPDPYVQITVESATSTSTVATDTFEPSWMHAAGTHDLELTDVVMLEMFDEDGPTDELVVACRLDLALPDRATQVVEDTLAYWCSGVRLLAALQ